MNAEERHIHSRISRRGFVGATAGATLAALAGTEPQLLRGATAAPKDEDCPPPLDGLLGIGIECRMTIASSLTNISFTKSRTMR